MAELLESDGIGEDADFFASGGNSLLSTRLVARVRDEIGTDISLRTIADLRTPARIAAAAAAGGRTADWRTIRAQERSHAQVAIESRPLSVAQHALWFLYQASGPAPDYNVAFTRRLTGPLDIEALRAAMVDLVDRHEALRTVIYTVADEAEQFVMDTPTALLAGADLCVRATDDLDRDLTAALGYAFDLTAEPAFRPVLFRLSETESVLLVLTHHLFADEWSETVLWRDLARAYRARSAGTEPEMPALPVTYTDYARWQRAALSGSELAAQRAFWRTALADLPEQLDLPTDRPYAPGLSTDGDAVTIELPRPVMAGLRALAHHAETTPFVVWHALVALLLHRNGAGVDLPLGTPVTGRGTVELDGVVGMFVNSVVLRADLSGNPTFSELIRRLSAADLAAFARQDLPFERVVELIEPPRVLGRNPLFQTMVVYSDAASAGPRLPGVTDEPLAARLQTAKFDLSLTLTDDASAPPTATVRYRMALFDRTTAQRLADELGQLAERVAAEPDLPLARIDQLPPAERVRTLETWNATAAPASDTTWPELDAAQVAATPAPAALVCGEESLTYRELDEQSRAAGCGTRRRRSGRRARRGHPRGPVDGARCGAARGAARRRSLRAAGAELAAAPDRGDAAYEWPGAGDQPGRERVGVVRRAGAHRRDHPRTAAPRTCCARSGEPRVRDVHLRLDRHTEGRDDPPARHREPACCGSATCSAFGPGDAALFKAPMGFDISVNEIFLPLVCGAKLVVCPPGAEREVDALAELIAEQQVTFCYLTSSMLALLLEAGPAERLSRLRHVWCGGELLTPELFARFRSSVGATMYHGYGPAETTIGVSHEIYRAGQERGAVTIGRPNPNTAIYLLDEWLRPVSVGVPGELYIGGLLLGRGYAGQPRRTAERFVANPFGRPGERLYRTGDLARRRADGVLEFLGRADNQIKIRGMRVEPEEIEATLVRHPAVRHAAVRTHHDGPSVRLVGYYVAAAEPINETELRAWLSERLPAHMVPERLVGLPALLMLRQRSSRSALAAPDTQRASRLATAVRPRRGPAGHAVPAGSRAGRDRRGRRLLHARRRQHPVDPAGLRGPLRRPPVHRARRVRRPDHRRPSPARRHHRRRPAVRPDNAKWHRAPALSPPTRPALPVPRR